MEVALLRGIPVVSLTPKLLPIAFVNRFCVFGLTQCGVYDVMLDDVSREICSPRVALQSVKLFSVTSPGSEKLAVKLLL